MDEKNLRVLVLEDVAADAELMVHELHRAGGAFDWQRVSREQDFAAALDDPPDVVLADYAMPGFGVSEAIAIMRARSLDIPFGICGLSTNLSDARPAMRCCVKSHGDFGTLGPIRSGSGASRRTALPASCRTSRKPPA